MPFKVPSHIQKLWRDVRKITDRIFLDPGKVRISRDIPLIAIDIGTNPVTTRGWLKFGSAPIYTVGLGLQRSDSRVITTYTDESEFNDEEGELLKTVASEIRGYPSHALIVTYNGKAFDIPAMLIRSKMLGVNDMNVLMRHKHLDVYLLVRYLKKTGRFHNVRDPSMSLKVNEVFFGFRRTAKTARAGRQYLMDDVTGVLAIITGLMGG